MHIYTQLFPITKNVSTTQPKSSMSKLLFLFYFFQVILAGQYSSKTNVVAYWGQGPNQESLGTYCANKNMGIVLISFLNNWNSTAISHNFGNACSGLTCPRIEEDIKKCQKLGVKVLLSLGGDNTAGTYGVSNDDEGKQVAKLIYDMFNPDSISNTTKPFGKAKIDGFDFDIENGIDTGLGSLVTELRTLWDEKLLISATPQCVYPDDGTSLLLSDASAKVDFVFVQFYNNPSCGINTDGFTASWDTWTNFTINQSGNPNKMKIFIGVCTACNSEYVLDIDDLNAKTEVMRKNKYFGGFTLWEVSTATKKIKNGLDYVSGLNHIIKNKKLPTSDTRKRSVYHFSSYKKRSPIVLQPKY